MRKTSTLALAGSLAVLLAVALAPAALAKGGKVDLNTASQQELEALKGVGAATAKKIIEHRPYASVDELSKAGLNGKKVADLKPFVTVSAVPAAPAAAAPAAAPAASAASSAKAAPAAAAAAVAGPVDINTADAKTLESLPGVGGKLAADIVKGRPYKSVDDLANVKGIGKAKLEKLRPLVTVGGAAAAAMPAAIPAAIPAAKAAAPASMPASAPASAPAASGAASSAAPKAAAGAHPAVPKLAPGELVNINTASKDKLDALPGIGPVKAQAIIDARPFAKIEDVMKVKGIKEGEFGKIKNLITVQ